MSLNLSVNIGALKLKNPIITASGTFGYGLELVDFTPPEILGAVITKGLSLTPWPGNPGPRMAESGGGLLNAIGLENMGVDAFIRGALDPLKASGAVVGANILGGKPEDYAALAKKLRPTAVDFIEVNISCPNVASGGVAFGADPVAAAEVTKAVTENYPGPVVVKLTPLTADVVKVATAVEEAGATAVALINTIPAMAIDLATRRPALANVFGGLSGPPVKPVALRQVYLCAKALKIPVIGLGGIFTATDALEFIVAGATAVQIGTATLVDPRAPRLILEGMVQWLKDNNINDVNELRGTLNV